MSHGPSDSYTFKRLDTVNFLYRQNCPYFQLLEFRVVFTLQYLGYSHLYTFWII